MELTIDLTEQQIAYLKQFASNQAPGSWDSLGTPQPIHVVQSKRYNYYPYAPERANDFEHLIIKFFFQGKLYDSEVEVLWAYLYDRWPAHHPTVRTFNELRDNVMVTADNEGVRISNYEDYFNAYGLYSVQIVMEDWEYEDRAFFFILENARKYKKYQAHNLHEPRTFTFNAGEGNKGEYEHFWQLLFNIGQKLLTMDTIGQPEEK